MQAWYRTPTWLWLLLPFSLLFGLIAGVRRRLFRWGLKPVYRAPVPVVIVGNLSVGGNGKTPLVIWLVEWLRKQGFRPGVISRGYGGKSETYPLRLTGDTGPEQAGDEPVLIHRRCGCPVVVAPDRAAAARQLVTLGVDIIISDDGLQHYALARDIELVVVDGQRRFGNGYLLPMGPLREGLWRLGGVTAVVNNGGPAAPGEYLMTLASGELNAVGEGEGPCPSVGSQVHAMAGIGNPGRFFTTLTEQGFVLDRRLALADHKGVTPAALAEVQSRPLLMTEKDAVKWRGGHDDAWFLPVDAHLPGEFEQLLLTRLKELHHGH
ncbi:tetraacyldisaccharide 4'-kinase [Zobellella maritima]|uniref:tetraacyldisaccharide 4'-kinase n=1 Tax=Zobellella maritima TaxID=2059725 RepID=UPI000E302C5B|nr:tetraacyldisaccharide 4'-kinase [Zobellella maritima]